MYGRPPRILVDRNRQRCQGIDVVLDEDRNSVRVDGAPRYPGRVQIDEPASKAGQGNVSEPDRTQELVQRTRCGWEHHV
jgi:hypothetical protein